MSDERRNLFAQSCKSSNDSLEQRVCSTVRRINGLWDSLSDGQRQICREALAEILKLRDELRVGVNP